MCLILRDAEFACQCCTQPVQEVLSLTNLREKGDYGNLLLENSIIFCCLSNLHIIFVLKCVFLNIFRLHALLKLLYLNIPP